MKNNELFLQALEEAGVNNWEGYSFAIDRYEEKIKEKLVQDKFSDIINDIFADCSVTMEENNGVNILYDGNIATAYNLVKDFVLKVEKS